jgi:alpha-glucosidase
VSRRLPAIRNPRAAPLRAAGLALAALAAACSSTHAQADAVIEAGAADGAAESAAVDAAQDPNSEPAIEAAAEAESPKPLCGFGVEVVEGARLVVKAPDGRVLLDGLAPGPVASGGPPKVGFAVQQQSTSFEMMFGSFKPTVSAQGPWRVAAQLLVEDAGEVRHVDLLDSEGAALARLTAACPSPGHLQVLVEPGGGPERRLSWGFGCNAADHFAGFGAQTWDTDHRGQTVPTWVQEEGIGKLETDTYDDLLWYMAGRRHSSHLPIPQFLARRGYILTTQTDAQALFALCSESDDAARVEVDIPLAVHLFDGPSPAQAIERATAFFGRPRLPPRMAFAPWLDAVKGTAAVLAQAKAARDAQIPASVMWTEDWRGGSTSMMGTYDLKEEWEVDPSLYPDLQSMSDQLHASGYALFVYFNPFVFKDSKAWSETAPNGFLIQNANGEPYTFQGATLLDPTSMLDVTNPGARAWALGKMKAALALGADGWMADFGEWLPTDAKLHGGSGMQWHNRYPVLWQELSREALDAAGDASPRMFFARSGWFGTPQLADAIWAGDQRTTFDRDDGMPVLIPIGIGLGVVGISTYGHDIAGYNSLTNAAASKELFFRWTALGAWSPVMRTHHGNQPDKNWRWDKDAQTTAHFRRYAKLHMSLVPMWEGLARVASQTGMPIWRGMALQFPEDEAVWAIDDQVMVGSGILVAPVQRAGDTSRSVYLPKGLWYSWEGEDAVAGPVQASVVATLEELPVYARAGTIVPAWPDGVQTVFRESPGVPGPSWAGQTRVVTVFLGADGAFEEASGLSYRLEAFQDGWYGALSFRWQGAPLGPCESVPQAPCASAGAHLSELHVLGPGVIDVNADGAQVARIHLEGGEAGRRSTVRIRH